MITKFNYEHSIDFRQHYQYIDYNKLNFNDITPFIKKYFSPSTEINNNINYIENKYNINNYDDICVLFYRGNDKVTEMYLPSYEDILVKARSIYEKNKNIKFLIQSDEIEFIETMIKEFPNNSFYFKDEIRTINKNQKISVDKINHESNFIYSQYYLAITIIMSKCKYIVCTSGNCSLWIALFRGNAENMYQIIKQPRNLNDYLNNKGLYPTEGYSQEISQQVEDLINLTSKPNIKVMEIGFNAGHSAEVFLQNNKSLTLTSFDLNEHDYVIPARGYIDSVFPNRHKLIIGDSRTSIPNYLQKNKGDKFDVIFIDGGHDYEIAKTDMENCFHLAHKDTIVILDDTMFTGCWERDWTIGPTKTWRELIQQNKIIEINHKDYREGRGIAWGKYVF